MNVSIDGLRLNMTSDVAKLKSTIEHLLADVGDYADSSAKQELMDAFDQVAQDSNILNCVFDDNVAGDFNDLSDNRVNYFSEEVSDDAII